MEVLALSCSRRTTRARRPSSRARAASPQRHRGDPQPPPAPRPPLPAVSIGFYVCALINFSALAAPAKNDDSWPTFLGREGVGAIVLWGLAYVSVAQSYRACPWTVLVFAVEKAYYVLAWVALRKALAREKAGRRPERQLGWFYIAKPSEVSLAGTGAGSLFGLVDGACGIFFLVVALPLVV